MERLLIGSKRSSTKYATVRRFVHDELQAELKVPRPVSVHQDPEAVEKFKKKISPALKAFQEIFQFNKPLRYLCQDETRIGCKTETGRVITKRGIKPIAPVQWPRESFWLYGIVEPESGWQFTQVYNKLNSTNFQSFIDALSMELGDSVAVIQLDGAPAHKAKALVWPENLIPLFQPPDSPQVNPIERVWQFLKERWKGENFANLKQLRHRVALELKKVTFEQIQSLTSYDFILDALFALGFT